MIKFFYNLVPTKKSCFIKMNSNFFNVSDIFAFEEAIFQCQLGLSLGLTRPCYLCSHYVQKSFRIENDRLKLSREEMVEYCCWKILQGIERREGHNREIFIVSLGSETTRRGFQLYAEYFIQINPVVRFIQQPVNICNFTSKFLESTNIQ